MKKKKIKKLKLERVLLGYQDKHTKNGPILYPPPSPNPTYLVGAKGQIQQNTQVGQLETLDNTATTALQSTTITVEQTTETTGQHITVVTLLHSTVLLSAH